MAMNNALKNKNANAAVYASLVRGATDLAQLRCVAERIIHSTHAGDVFLGNLLLQAFGKLHSIGDAADFFQGMAQTGRNIFSWSIMISALSRNGRHYEALEHYHAMNQDGGVQPDMVVFSAVIGVCSVLHNLCEGKKLHARVSGCGLEPDTVVRNALVSMYATCGCLEDARAVFDAIATQDKDAVSWNVMMEAYTSRGKFHDALHIFDECVLHSLQGPDAVSFVTAISACCGLSDLQRAQTLEKLIAARGFDASVGVQNALVNLYGKCGSLSQARMVFDNIIAKTVVSWNSIIAAHGRAGDSSAVLSLCQRMDQEGVKLTKATYVSLISSWCCDGGGTMGYARRKLLSQVRSRVLVTDLLSDVVVGTCLVDAYARCWGLEEARAIFDSVPEKNAQTWNSMIGACILYAHNDEAVQMFHEMELEGVRVTEVTLIVVLGACTSDQYLEFGKRIHKRACGQPTTTFLNSLVNMYAKCACLEAAKRIFNTMEKDKRDVVTWNAMISAYMHSSRDREAVELYTQMHKAEPDSFTFASVVTACANLNALEEGESIHERIVGSGKEPDGVVASALIAMYGKCDDLEKARLVFDRVVAAQRDAVCWNAIISACAQRGCSSQAFELFHEMEVEGIKPVSASFVSILAACSSVSMGRDVEVRMASVGLLDSGSQEIGAALINMYSRCGGLEEARRVFDEMLLVTGVNNKKSNTTVCWTAMFAAYSHHGCARQGLELLSLMSLNGVEPNEINFTSLLNACSHEGLRSLAWKSFTDMVGDYGVAPAPPHWTCLSDMLGRAGLVNDAQRLIDNDDAVALKSLLSACKAEGNVAAGARVAHRLVELQPLTSTPYVLLSEMLCRGRQVCDTDKGGGPA